MSERKMATIRTISEIKEHPNADALELAVIDGWQVVVKKDEFFPEEMVVYFEIDSWVPTEVAEFLSKGKEPREYEGVKGERLRSIKLRGQLSQGLVLPLGILQETENLEVGQDVSEELNVNKWERPISPQLAGLAKGNFPSFLRKTDQERIQNMFKKLTPEHFEDEYEITLKLDGSSCTFYHKDGTTGVCSRNLELKTDENNINNAFVKMFAQLGLDESLKSLGKNIAVQGELWGSGINGNWEGISDVRFNVFDVFDIDKQQFVNAYTRYSICAMLGVDHVPVVETSTLGKFSSVQDFLEYAERPSIYAKKAEGVVYKSLSNPEFSFKAVSNSYLMSGGE